MSSMSVIVEALVPVAFVILLGLLAGRQGLVNSAQSGVLSALALDFCLPALLFTATAQMTIAQFED